MKKYHCGDLVRKIDKNKNISQDLYQVLDKVGFLIVIKKNTDITGFEYVKSGDIKLAQPANYITNRLSSEHIIDCNGCSECEN